MIKTTGAEFKAYYNDPYAWPEGCWHDGEIMTIDGVKYDDWGIGSIHDASNITIQYGIIFGLPDAPQGLSMEKHFLIWRSLQKDTLLLVAVPKDREKAFRMSLPEFQGKILS